MRKSLYALLAVAALLPLAGCGTVSSLVSDAVIATTSATPTQATTVAEATQATTLVEQAVDLYVQNSSPSPAVLSELKTLVTGLHATLLAAQTANASGNSATAAAGLSAFNEALAAYEAYAAKQGISS